MDALEKKKGRITDISIAHLSAIFGTHKGEEWAPINDDAKMLFVKGGPKDGVKVKGSAGFLAKLARTFKGMFDPVSVDVADNIDNDGDGADDYNEICGLVSNLYYDLSSAYGISDDQARAAAITTAIDNFLEQLDECRGTDDEAKGGKRHSAADQGHIDAISEAQGKLSKAVDMASKANDAISEHAGALGSSSGDASDSGYKGAVIMIDATKAEPTVTIDDVGEDGLATYEVTASTEEIARASLTEAIQKADKAPYGDVDYADPGYQDDKVKRYPLDTAAHVKAAASYFGMDKNRSKYTAEQQKSIDAKIAAAKTKFNIGDASDSNDKGAPSSMTANIAGDVVSPEHIAKAVQDALATFKSESEAATKTAIETAVTAAVETVKAESKTETDALRAELEKANGLLKGIVKDARQPSSPGFAETVSTDGTRHDPANEKPAAKAEAQEKMHNGKVSSIAEAVALARIANS